MLLKAEGKRGVFIGSFIHLFIHSFRYLQSRCSTMIKCTGFGDRLEWDFQPTHELAGDQRQCPRLQRRNDIESTPHRAVEGTISAGKSLYTPPGS